jgi:hypothetical protein
MKLRLMLLIIGMLFGAIAFAQNRMNRYMPSPNYTPGNNSYNHGQYSQQGFDRSVKIPAYAPGYCKADEQKYRQADTPQIPLLPLYNNRQLYGYKNLYDYIPR